MELWIRSQNKEVLVKCNCLALEEQTEGKYTIINYSGLEFYQFLGTYDYERALEVLDEIQNMLFYKKMSEDNISTFSKKITDKYGEYVKNKIYMSTAVYEMPKE